jgi:hypothetical protein
MITAEKITALGYLLGRLTMSPTDMIFAQSFLDELLGIVEAQEEALEEAQPLTDP